MTLDEALSGHREEARAEADERGDGTRSGVEHFLVELLRRQHVRRPVLQPEHALCEGMTSACAACGGDVRRLTFGAPAVPLPPSLKRRSA